jgi:hypothetical protein
VKNDRDERNTQGKLPDQSSIPPMQVSAKEMQVRGSQKKKIKPGKLSDSAVSRGRK